MQTTDQLTARQEGGGHVLVTADLTNQHLRQTQKLLLVFISVRIHSLWIHLGPLVHLYGFL